MSARSAATSGRDLLAQFAEIDGEVHRCACEARLRIVVREGDIELGRLTDPQTDQVRLEAGDEPLLADDDRHPVGGAALERLAVARPDERDHRVIAVLGAPVLDRGERRVLVPQFLDDPVDLRVVDRLDLGPEVEVRVVAERHLRPDLDGRLEDDRLALLGLDDLHLRIRQRQDRLFDERLAIRGLDEMLHGLVEDDARAERPLEDGPRRLAWSEARDARPTREALDGLVDRAGQSLGWQLDLEQDGTLRCGRGSDIHRPGSIGRRARARPGGGHGGGRRGRGRTDTPLTRHRLLRPARLPFRHSPEVSLPRDAGSRLAGALRGLAAALRA
jgi:hypothetical protein